MQCRQNETNEDAPSPPRGNETSMAKNSESDRSSPHQQSQG